MTYTPFDLHVQVFFEEVEELSIKEPTLVLQLDIEPCWIDPLANYLYDKIVLVD